MKMKLEAGKKYVNRMGDIVGPLTPRDSAHYPWIDIATGNLYTDVGRFWPYGLESEHDLIAEVGDAK